MDNLRRKPILLVVSVLVALAAALGAVHRSKTALQAADPEARNAETGLTTHFTKEREPMQSRTSESLSPQSVGLIDRSVIAGGGGTSSSGN